MIAKEDTQSYIFSGLNIINNTTITVELIYAVAMEVGLRFAIREGGRTIGAGQVTEIIE